MPVQTIELEAVTTLEINDQQLEDFCTSQQLLRQTYFPSNTCGIDC